MKLLDATLHNYKSIIKTHIEFQPDVTCLVGITGSGKTAILELLQRINHNMGFNQRDLPKGSTTLAKFTDNCLRADEILQLVARFKIDEMDHSLLHEQYKKATEMHIRRFFDGRWEVDIICNGLNNNQPQAVKTDEIKHKLDSLQKIIQDAESRIPDIKNHIEQFAKYGNDLISGIKKTPASSGDFLHNFKNNLFAMYNDDQLRANFNQIVGEMESEINDIMPQNQNNPKHQVYDQVVPKPEYISELEPPMGSIQLDDYLNNNDMCETFSAIGRICSFTKDNLNNIRNAKQHTQQNFFDKAAKKLTKEFKKFWNQTPYEIIINLNDQNLILQIRDSISDKITSVTQVSEGLQWVLALFLKIKLLTTSRGSSKILLLDSPATAIHDAGKEDIRKFMTTMAEKNNLQIIYTTHEKALIDPWRLDRIRFVQKTRNEGTMIKELNPSRIDSTRIEISKYIESPAKYSLFGAPITVLFEGSSNCKFIAALNEYAKQTDREHLHQDIYAIDDVGGMDNAPSMIKILKNLDVKYVCVVDGGTKTKTIQKKVGDSEFEKNFIQITDVVDKPAADIEDLIDPQLYNALFKSAYSDVNVPDNYKDELKGQKTTKYYTNLLNPNSSHLNKTGIASILMNMIKNPPSNIEASLCNTMKKYEKLVRIIERKTRNNNTSP